MYTLKELDYNLGFQGCNEMVIILFKKQIGKQNLTIGFIDEILTNKFNMYKSARQSTEPKRYIKCHGVNFFSFSILI